MYNNSIAGSDRKFNLGRNEMVPSMQMFLISILTVLVLMGSGYCYGRVYQKFCGGLKRFSCTFLGTFTIIALFQIWVFFAVPSGFSTRYSLLLAGLLILAGPVLAIITHADLKVRNTDLRAWITGLIFSLLICIASARLNLNSVYFDTITYLSETLESSTADRFAYMLFDRGVKITWIDNLHDYTGYYYFWGMLLRAVRGISGIRTSLTPVYIWAGTIFYAMSLGELTWNAIIQFYRKNPWRSFLVVILVLSPYYTNYFNTTLGFFGNTIRTVITGWSIFLAYQILLRHESRLFFPLAMTYLAAVCATSSGFFLSAFVQAALVFAMALTGESDEKVWKGFALSCIPIVHYAEIILISSRISQPLILAAGAVLAGSVLWLAVSVLKNHLQGFDRFLSYLLPLVIAGLAAVSFLFCRQDYPYSDFFKATGLTSMGMNFFAYDNWAERLRNLIFYVLLFSLFFHLRLNHKMKTMIFLFLALFLNPLVMPAVEKYMTAYVYVRAFDLLINPFVLTFLVYNFDRLVTGRILNPELKAILAISSTIVLLFNILDTNSGSLRYKGVGWDWKLKVTEDSYEMYQYIQDNLSSSEDSPSIMSQDINLKGYVTGVEISFSSTEFREVLGNPEAYPDKLDLVRLLYPTSHYPGQKLLGQEIDYTKLPDLIMSYDPDYLLISNQTAVWNDRGWYDKVYLKLEADGLAEMQYQNDTWALLKINHDYQAEGQEG